MNIIRNYITMILNGLSILKLCLTWYEFQELKLFSEDQGSNVTEADKKYDVKLFKLQKFFCNLTNGFTVNMKIEM